MQAREIGDLVLLDCKVSIKSQKGVSPIPGYAPLDIATYRSYANSSSDIVDVVPQIKRMIEDIARVFESVTFSDGNGRIGSIHIDARVTDADILKALGMAKEIIAEEVKKYDEYK